MLVGPSSCLGSPLWAKMWGVCPGTDTMTGESLWLDKEPAVTKPLGWTVLETKAHVRTVSATRTQWLGGDGEGILSLGHLASSAFMEVQHRVSCLEGIQHSVHPQEPGTRKGQKPLAPTPCLRPHRKSKGPWVLGLETILIPMFS